MTTTISPQVRLLALVGLLAVAALVAGTQLVARGVLLSKTSDAVAAPPEARAPATKKATPAAKKVQVAAKEKASEKASAKAAATASAKPADAKAKTPARATAKATAETSSSETRGLPVALAHALGQHKVVVVSLFTPDAPLDRLARDEARAGAEAAGAGFVALNVLGKHKSRKLAAKLGVLDAPAVLVYTKPAKLSLQIDGFADLDTVAQAAADARR